MKTNRFMHWVWLLIGFSGLAVAIYWPAQHGDWEMDDVPNIVNSFRLSDFSDSLRLLLQPRGLSFLSFALNIKLVGLDPSAFRWVNVFIHSMNSLLVVLLVRQLTGSLWRWAIAGGLIFLCHPVQTSAVSYIVQRMTLLSAFFALLAILLVDRYLLLVGEGRGTESRKFLFLSVICGIFSVMAKENTVLLPLMIPLLAWFRGKGRLSAGWKSAFILWLSISVAAILLHSLTIISPIEHLEKVPLFKDTGQILYDRLEDHDRGFLPIRYFLSQLEVFWIYLGLIIFPLHQALDYSWPIPDLRFSLLHLGTLALILATLWFSYNRRDRQPFLFFGLAWIFIFIIVESSIIPLDPIFEHRLYFPLIGVILIFSGLDALWAKKVAFSAAVMVVCVFAFMSWQRNQTWGDTVSLWQSNVRVVERAPRPVSKLVAVLFAKKRFTEAAEEIRRLYVGESGLGEVLFFSGKTDEAMAAFRKAALESKVESNEIELFSGYKAIQEKKYVEAAELLNRAELRTGEDVRTLYFRGLLAEQQNDLFRAVEYYVRSINSIESSYTSCYVLWAKERRTLLMDELSEWFNRENTKVLITPKNRQIRVDFANLLMRMGLYREAIGHYEALEAMGVHTESLYYTLAFCYERLREFHCSDKNYKISLKLSPNNLDYSLDYANSLVKRGKFSAAHEVLSPLMQLYPKDGRLLIMSGDVLWARGEIKTARNLYLRASLIPGYQRMGTARLSSLAD